MSLPKYRFIHTFIPFHITIKAYTAQQLHNLILQTMTFCELLYKRSFIECKYSDFF